MSEKNKSTGAPLERDATAEEPISTQDYPMPAPPAPDTDAITTQDYPMPAPPAPGPDTITTKDYP
ncbi:hypothetical protein PV377_45690, partial [Streptomyces ipomoeae]